MTDALNEIMLQANVTELHRKLMPEHLQRLAEATDIATMLDLFERYQWDKESEIEELTSLARQDENLSVKLAAIKYLRELLYEAMKQAGLMVKATKVMHGADGTTLTFSADLVAASLRGKKGDLQNGRTEEVETEDSGGGTSGESRRSLNVHKPPTERQELFPGISINPAREEDY